MDKILKIVFWVVIAVVSFVIGWSLKAWSLSNKKGA